MATLICLGCDREYEGPFSRGYCVACTIANMKANGIHCSIHEAISMGKPMVENPHLIVKLVVK